MSRHLTELMMSEADDRMEVEKLLTIERERRNHTLCQELEDRGRVIDWDYFGVEDETGQLV